jgi:uncharacterized membrane protein
MSIYLPPDQLKRRRELTSRLREGTITIEEAEELRQILELEKQQAEDTNDLLAIFAIAGLLLLVAAVIYESGKKKKSSKFKLPF